MKFSKAWLQTYSKDILPDTKILEDVVTFNAFEIEEITFFPSLNVLDYDTILDIKVLPNRAHDALGHRGMARDMCALTGRTFTDPHAYYHGEADGRISAPNIDIEDELVCTRFMSVRIENISVADSPTWLKERLASIGQKSINSIVDITNFVQFSINKPMHAYDASLISGNTLSARYAKVGETLTTLDDKSLTLDEKTLVIADSEKPLGLAGIKGGKFSGVSSTTSSVIVESANFNGPLIRKTSQKYGIRTDASKRFENMISDTLVEEGLRLTISLILEMNPLAKVSTIVDIYPHVEEKVTVSVSVAQINKVLGTSLTSNDVENVFTALSFSHIVENDIFIVTVPSERLDIRIKEDLIEEVARVRGLSSIPSVLPALHRKGIVHKRMFYENKIRKILFEQGFSDIMTYSFGNVGEVEIIKGQASDKEKLRSTLGAGVQQAFQMNMLNAPLMKLDTIKMYEFGNIFTKDTERRHLALCIDDGKKKSSFTEETEMLLGEIKRTLTISSIECDTFSTKPYVIEIDFDTLIASLPEPTSYEPLSQNPLSSSYQAISPYPFIVRDIAMWVPESTSWESISTLCDQVGNALVIRIDLFDTFSKEVEGVKKISFAFRLVFQSFEKTLTDEEANEMMKPYYDIFKNKGYEIR
jgi:phenylalanyl-tRNA synthetase beta chain